MSVRTDIAPYRAACLQLALFARSENESGISAYRRRAADYLDRTIGNLKRQSRRPELRLVLVPEFWLSGLMTPETRRIVPDTVPGEITDMLCSLAAAHRCFIAANVIEGDPRDGAGAPRRFFDSAVIASDEGKIVLHYREVAALAHGGSETDLDDFWQLRESPPGARAAATLPVADTELGRLAVIVGSDIRYGSTSRGYSCRGADVLIHLANEGEWCTSPWRFVKAARARENGVFVLSCTNAGDEVGISSEAGQSPKGGSRILDARGRLLAATESTREAIVEAVVDLRRELEPALRRRRPSLDRLGIHDASPVPASAAALLGGAAAPLAREDATPVVVAELSYERRATGRLEEVTTLSLAVAGSGAGAGAAQCLRMRNVEDLSGRGDGLGGELVEWSTGAAGEPAVLLWSDDAIDFIRSGLVSIVSIGVSSDGSQARPLHRYRVQALRGGQAVRHAALAGSRAVVISAYGRHGGTDWDELVQWSQVLAWESEVAVLLLGDSDVSSFGVAAPAERATRRVAQIDESGEVLWDRLVDADVWTTELTTALGEEAGRLRRGRDRFRHDIDAYASALEPEALSLG